MVVESQGNGASNGLPFFKNRLRFPNAANFRQARSMKSFRVLNACPNFNPASNGAAAVITQKGNSAMKGTELVLKALIDKRRKIYFRVHRRRHHAHF
jgi:hypothetical protein